MDWTQEVAGILDQWRREAGLSYAAVVRKLYEELGTYALSTVEGVRAYHRPASMPGRPDLLHLVAFIEMYGHTIDDLGPKLAGELRSSLASVRALLERNA